MKRETYEYYTAKILKQLMMGYGETMQDNPAVGFTIPKLTDITV